MTILSYVIDTILFGVCLFLLAGSLFITWKMRFVQLRLFPMLFKLVKAAFEKRGVQGTYTISPHKALFTAMSTTLGIGTIVAPVIAISLGGAGALLGFLLTSFFGAAATFSEVELTLMHRKKLASGVILGGPMPYLRHLLSPKVAKWYAVGCLLLMMAWSSAQANQLTALLDSPLLGIRIPSLLSGLVIALFIFVLQIGGIKRIGAFSAKIVPLMFLLYVSACLWILFCNVDKWGALFKEILSSFFSPYPLATGGLVGGVVSALRWGVFKGMQTNEAGVGTQAFPHAMAETEQPQMQAALAMLSTYTAGLIAFLSGCVALLTKTWQNPELPLGMSMVVASFHLYFSHLGVTIIALCSILFGFGTILGNCYNAGECFAFLTDDKNKKRYMLATSLMIFLGCIAQARTVWSLIDIILALIAVPHMVALLIYAHQSKKIYVNN